LDLCHGRSTGKKADNNEYIFHKTIILKRNETSAGMEMDTKTETQDYARFIKGKARQDAR
jgi:hypothetical protein